MNCPYCDSDILRNSRFRFPDVFHLLLLQLPVRCRNCGERSYVHFSLARKMRQEAKLRHRQHRIRKDAQTSAEGKS